MNVLNAPISTNRNKRQGLKNVSAWQTNASNAKLRCVQDRRSIERSRKRSD